MKKGQINDEIKNIEKMLDIKTEYYTYAYINSPHTTEAVFDSFVERLKEKSYEVISIYYRNDLIIHDLRFNKFYVIDYDMETIKDIAHNILVNNNIVILSHGNIMPPDDVIDSFIYNLNYENGVVNTSMVYYHIHDTDKKILFNPNIQNSNCELSEYEKREINVMMEKRRKIRDRFFKKIEDYTGIYRVQLYGTIYNKNHLKDFMEYYFGGINNIPNNIKLDKNEIAHYLNILFKWKNYKYYPIEFQTYLVNLCSAFCESIFILEGISLANEVLSAEWETDVPNSIMYTILCKHYNEVQFSQNFTIDDMYDIVFNDTRI